MDIGISEGLFGIAGTIIGLLVGHKLTLGRDRRVERNEARYPIWNWFQSNPPGSGKMLPHFEYVHRKDINKYKFKAPSREWHQFVKHCEAINLVREQTPEGIYNVEEGTLGPGVEPTQAQLDTVSENWQAIIRLTRQR